VTWPRVGFMVGLLVVGLVLTRVLGKTRPHVSKTQAVQIARPKVDFTPEGHNIRLVRRGIPSRPYWVISFWIRKSSGGGGYKRITVVLVDSTSGRIAEVRRVT
jgi:hypothetical protein